MKGTGCTLANEQWSLVSFSRTFAPTMSTWATIDGSRTSESSKSMTGNGSNTKSEGNQSSNSNKKSSKREERLKSEKKGEYDKSCESNKIRKIDSNHNHSNASTSRHHRLTVS
jgi:hypothetical protein